MLIGLISSVTEEGKVLIKHLRKKSVAGGKQIFSGQIHGKDIIYTISGMGKTNAAHAATVLLEKFSPDIIILFGIGGTYPSSSLKIGDIAIAEKEIYAEEGVIVKDGFHDIEFIGIPLLKKGNRRYFNEFPLDRKLVIRVVNSLRTSLHDSQFTLKGGSFVTVSTCTGTKKKAIELKKRYNAICENMEGVAVSQVCAMYGTPMLEIRGISNIVEDRDKNKWDIKVAADNCQKMVMELLKIL